MAAKMWIASKPVHLFLVYDPDGNPYSGDEKVFRGGPKISIIPPDSKVELEVWVDIKESADSIYDESGTTITYDPYTDRNYTEIASGSAADDMKNDISDRAGDFGTPDSSGKIITDVPYTVPLVAGDPTHAVPATNSNTTIKSAAAYAGVDVEDNMPYEEGDPTNPRLSPESHGGIESFYSASDQAIETDNGQDRIFNSTGGDNTYEINVSQFGTGTIVIAEDDDTGTLDKIVLNNIDAEDVRFERDLNGDLKIYFPWDDDGKPSIVIKDQFDNVYRAGNWLTGAALLGVGQAAF